MAYEVQVLDRDLPAGAFDLPVGIVVTEAPNAPSVVEGRVADLNDRSKMR